MAVSAARRSPTSRSRLNLTFDLFVVSGVFVVARSLSGALLVALIWAVTSFVIRYYDSTTVRQGMEDIALVSILVVCCSIAVGLLQRVGMGSPDWPRADLLAAIVWPVVVTARLAVFRRLDLQAAPAEDVLVVGTGALARCTTEDLTTLGPRRRAVVGLLRFRDEPAVEAVAGFPVLGDVAELEGLLRARVIDEVYVAGHYGRSAPEMQEVVKTCERFGIPFALPAHPLRLARAHPVVPGAIADGYLHYSPHSTRPHQRALKRLFDIAVSASALALLAPVFGVVTLLVKLTSPGPVFFRQTRVGLRGRPFAMLKFRTMVQDAERRRAQLEQLNEQTGPVFKIRKDPRITPIGHFLRRHSIDELPQLLNVLRGEMSIVGPRPPIPSEVEKYEGWQRRRLSVRPGLTCIWQVSGRNQISFEEWMLLDMQYIDHWSFRDDLQLVLRTFPVVLTGRGAS